MTKYKKKKYDTSLVEYIKYREEVIERTGETPYTLKQLGYGKQRKIARTTEEAKRMKKLASEFIKSKQTKN